jgi:hypothetical protein
MDLFSAGHRPSFRDRFRPDEGKRERYEEMVHEIIRELYSNASYWEFFDTFSEESVHDFIPDYAARKAWYLLNGPLLLRKKEREQFRFRDLAEKCFWEIQQKKLFNLQCEWRAGLAEPEGVRVTRDFYCLEKKIRNLDLLSPVTADEVCMYIDYLKSGLYAEKKWYVNWQDYDTFRNCGENSGDIPAWYQFHDQKTGSGYLALLPDRKGEEEMKCMQALRDNSTEAAGDMMAGHDGLKPELAGNYETIEFFISTFESRKLLSWFRAAEKKPTDQDAEAQLQDAWRILNLAEKPVKLPDAADWKEAVIKGAFQYKTSQIAMHIPLIFEEYLLRMRSGILYDEEGEDESLREIEAYALLYWQQVEEGKRMRK